MKREFLNHKLAYVILILGLVIFSASFFAAWPVRSLQRGVIALLVLFYFLWGIFSHITQNHISKKIVIEYLVVSLLAGLLLLLVTF